MSLYLLSIAFSLWMAVETVRRGQTSPWLFIVLFFGPLGAGVYLITQVLPQMRGVTSAKAANSINLRKLERDAERLDNLNAWTDYANGLRTKRRIKEAVQAANKAVDHGPSDPYALAELGYSLVNAGREAEAIEPLEKLIDQNPLHDHGDAMYALPSPSKRVAMPKVRSRR